MFRKFVVIAALALAPATMVLAPATAAAAEASPNTGKSAFERSVRLEVRGWEAMFDMWDHSTRGTDGWSEGARNAHRKGSDTYHEAQRLAAQGHYSKAHDQLAIAWRQHMPATREALDRAPEERADRILTMFTDSVAVRLTYMEKHLDGAPQSAKDSYRTAKATYDQAEAQHRAGNRSACLDTLSQALVEVHVAFQEMAKVTDNQRRRS